MANQDRVNFVWAESALTTIPPIPVSEVAYRDTTQTPEQMEVGQQYDTIYNSARHNQLLFLITSVAKTLCENGIMPFLAGQAYAQYARCIFTDGLLYKASRAILANEQPYPTPRDDSGVWIAEETSENLVPNSRRVIAGTGLTGGGPLSSDVTLSAKLDRKTTQAAAGGAITVKDVAIGGDLADLASARGQVGDLKIATATNYPSILTIRKSCRLYFNGTEWGKVADRPFEAGYGAVVIADVSSDALRGEIWAFSLSGNDAWKAQFNEQGTSPFARFVMSNAIGDGIRVTNGIISVPEYEGATASTAGTSGLVPPATAGQQESFLTGGGEYKPALTKISDSVNLADSKTAASAKAVKAAYDLANGKQAALGFTPVQQGGGANQRPNKVYLGWDGGAVRMQVDNTDMGQLVTTLAGQQKAPNAAWADGAQFALKLRREGGVDTSWYWNGQEGQPGWLWGGNDGVNMHVYDPANFSVNYANSAGSAPANGGTAWATTVTPNVDFVGRNGAMPNGGTWLYVYMPYDSHYLRGVALAGGAAAPSNDGGIAIKVA